MSESSWRSIQNIILGFLFSTCITLMVKVKELQARVDALERNQKVERDDGPSRIIQAAR